MEKSQAGRWLKLILAINIVATIFHYTDNFIFFDRYPAPTWMNTHHVYIAWSILIPFAIAGYIQYIKENFWIAYIFLGVYSITGTSSLGHYFYGSMANLSGKINTLICLDFISGIALLSFIFWSAFIDREWQEEELSK